MIKTLLIPLALLSSPLAFADPMIVSPLIVEADEASHMFTVEVADDAEEISYGLMNRDSMDADKGMLFDFTPPREPAMYMKNTLIPLDMLFISVDGKVEMVARNAVPGSLRTISPGVAVKAVLEINGGLAEDLGIQPGDTVRHSIFNNVETSEDTE